MKKDKKHKYNKRATLMSSNDKRLNFTNQRGKLLNDDLELDDNVRLVEGKELN